MGLAINYMYVPRMLPPTLAEQAILVTQTRHTLHWHIKIGCGFNWATLITNPNHEISKIEMCNREKKYSNRAVMYFDLKLFPHSTSSISE